MGRVTTSACAGFLAAVIACSSPEPAATATAAPPLSDTPVPLVKGLVLVYALQFPSGDRENVVVVDDVTPVGVTYRWRVHERRAGTERDDELGRFVGSTDLAGAPRLNAVFTTRGIGETPGYTAFSLSRATLASLRQGREVAFTLTELDDDTRPGGLLAARLALKGTLAPVTTTPEPMPVLLDGHRVSVPALRVRGSFALQERKREVELWVLDDPGHPLLLKSISGHDVLQIIRIDRPGGGELDEELEKRCRAELSGVYFPSGSATLDPASESALARVAGLLGRHPDWTLALEGHTDSIGDAQHNRELSEKRATAVRAALVARGAAADRLRTSGFGPTRPRETNTTAEGRARNRRVELVRSCDQPR